MVTAGGRRVARKAQVFSAESADSRLGRCKHAGAFRTLTPLVGGPVNRSQLLNTFAERTDTSRKEADATVTAFVELITETVARGEDVAISGFAKFRRIDRPARMARNPATGEQVKVAAKRVARITPLKAFKDAVLSGKVSGAEGAGQEDRGQEGDSPEGAGEESTGDEEEGTGQEDRGEEDDGPEGAGEEDCEASLNLRPGTFVLVRRRERGTGPGRIARARSRARALPRALAARTTVPHRAERDHAQGRAPGARRHRRRRRLGRVRGRGGADVRGRDARRCPPGDPGPSRAVACSPGPVSTTSAATTSPGTRSGSLTSTRSCARRSSPSRRSSVRLGCACPPASRSV